MTQCERCGSDIGHNANICPFCGTSLRKQEAIPITQVDHETYRTIQNPDGSTSIKFSDGKAGRRLPSGNRTATATYKKGKGERTCPHCKTVQKATNKTCENCGELMFKQRLH